LINETALKGTDVVKKLTELRRAARALHSTSIIALAHKINTADTKNIPMVGILFDANVLNTTSKTWNAEADVTKKEIISHNNDYTVNLVASDAINIYAQFPNNINSIRIDSINKISEDEEQQH